MLPPKKITSHQKKTGGVTNKSECPTTRYITLNLPSGLNLLLGWNHQSTKGSRKFAVTQLIYHQSSSHFRNYAAISTSNLSHGLAWLEKIGNKKQTHHRCWSFFASWETEPGKPPRTDPAFRLDWNSASEKPCSKSRLGLLAEGS